MKTIHRYKIPVQDGKITIEMPNGAEILSVGNHSHEPSIISVWALVHTERAKGNFDFVVRGTGLKIGTSEEMGKFIGTVADGPYIWHVFHLV